MPDPMDRVAAVIRSYMDGQITLDMAAARLFVLWQDPLSGGWSLYLDEDRLSSGELARARTLERRFHDLVEQQRMRRLPWGTR